MLLATTAAASADQIAWCHAQIRAITSDPGWVGGDYERSREPDPVAGLEVARQIAHITYRSADELAVRFGRGDQVGESVADGGRYAVQSYLDHHGRKLARRFDAGSYVTLTQAMNSHDVGRDRGGVEAALGRVTARTIVAGIDSDRLFPVPDQEHPPVWYGMTTLAVIAAFLAFAPWWWWRLKKYQHDHYAYAGEQTSLRTGVGSFYGVFAETAGIGAAGMTLIVIAAVVLAVLGGVASAFGAGADAEGTRRGGMALAAMIVVAVFAVAMLAVQLVPRPYFAAKMQNLLWSRTASDAVAFESRLRFWPLFGLTLKNWLLIVLTLGLYWPFAAVATQRLKVEALTLLLAVDPQQLIARSRSGDGEAAGDAAGDLFGMDFGL